MFVVILLYMLVAQFVPMERMGKEVLPRWTPAAVEVAVAAGTAGKVVASASVG